MSLIESLQNQAAAKGIDSENYITEQADLYSLKCRILAGVASATGSVACFFAAGAMDAQTAQSMMISADHLNAASRTFGGLSLGSLIFYYHNADSTWLLSDYLGYKNIIPGYHSFETGSKKE